ncbi:MAG TPA: putative metal-binding motif-containing protein [Polyangiaceae bacterium]
MTFARLCIGLALLAATVAVGSAGCEAIVPNEVPAYTCAMTPFANPGNGTCPKGNYCKGSGCTACQTKDICDGYDNDCDGIIDDGPYSDHDGDGYTFCGRVDANSGQLTAVDCNDNDKTIYPGAKEVCNGKDDNCDGIIDNSDLVCAANETCVPKTGQCIPNAAACTPANCRAPDVCDPGTQQCVPPGTQDAGTTCSGDKACATGICGDPAELGPGKGGTCTKPCCTSADCDPGSICWGAGTGGNYCLDSASAGRQILGGNAPGASCSGNGDCRSGVCNANKCEDTCCNDASCTNGTVCVITSFGGNTTFACLAPPGNATTNQSCRKNSDCASGFCAIYSAGGGVTVNACASPCCSSSQCGQLLGNQLLCGDDFYPPTLTPPTSGPVVPVCDYVQQGTGKGKVGDPCPNGSGDCFSEQCAPNAMCTDVCCKDADCGKAGWVCRPTQVQGGTYLRCVPTPT